MLSAFVNIFFADSMNVNVYNGNILESSQEFYGNSVYNICFLDDEVSENSELTYEESF